MGHSKGTEPKHSIKINSDSPYTNVLHRSRTRVLEIIQYMDSVKEELDEITVLPDQALGEEDIE